MTRGLGREAGCSSVPASGQGRRRRSSTRRGGTGPSGPGRPRVSCADRGGGVSFSVELTRIAGPHNIGRMCIGRYYRLPPGQLVANPCPSGTTRMSVCQRPTGGVGRFATPLRRAAATGRRTRPAGCAGTTPEVRAALSGSACAGTRPGHVRWRPDGPGSGSCAGGPPSTGSAPNRPAGRPPPIDWPRGRPPGRVGDAYPRTSSSLAPPVSPAGPAPRNDQEWCVPDGFPVTPPSAGCRDRGLVTPGRALPGSGTPVAAAWIQCGRARSFESTSGRSGRPLVQFGHGRSR